MRTRRPAHLDQRWQLALGCLRASAPAFPECVLVTFRERLIAHDLDRTLLLDADLITDAIVRPANPPGGSPRAGSLTPHV